MSILKKLISSSYNFRMRFSKSTGLGIKVLKNDSNKNAIVNFYSLKAFSNSGEEISFEKYRGRKIIIVNLASQCGYTPQYEALEKLYQQKSNIEILGFPSNDFGEQEPGSDVEIARFCKLNFGVTFPLFKKDNVTGKNRQLIYQWLSNLNENGWNNEQPQWNFYKYVVDENGNLSGVYSSSVSPFDIPLSARR
jgi:glutathione peroxidase